MGTELHTAGIACLDRAVGCVILCTVTIGALQSSIKYVHLGSPRSVGGWRTASLEVGGKRDEFFLCL